MTGEELLLQAYAKSKKNQPDKIAAEAIELITIVNRVVRTFVHIGVRVNAPFFGNESAVAEVAGTWPRPTDAESVFRIETGGVEVAVVPFDQRDAEDSMPSVYRMGQVYRAAGLPNDPSGALDIFYAKRPTDIAALADPIDAMWPEAYAELAALEIAAQLANKDNRREELGFIVKERDRWLLLYLGFLEHETLNERRRWEPAFNTSTLVPISTMLTGGSDVEL